MSKPYTDEDVRAVMGRLLEHDVTPERVRWYPLARAQAVRILDAVAPTIAARTLREAADAHLPPYNCELRYDGSEDPEAARWVGYCADTDDFLRRRADEIDPNEPKCPTCNAPEAIVEQFDHQIGYEEKAREVNVTALACGHEIVRPAR